MNKNQLLNNNYQHYIASIMFVLIANIYNVMVTADYYFFILILSGALIFLFPNLYYQAIKKSLFSNLFIIALFTTGWLWMLYGFSSKSYVSLPQALPSISLIFISLLVFFRIYCIDIPFFKDDIFQTDIEFSPIRIPKLLLFIIVCLSFSFMVIIPGLPFRIDYAFYWLALIILVSLCFLVSDILNNNKWYRIENVSKGELIYLLILATLCSILFLHDLTSWKYAIVGDEYNFFFNAINLIKDKSISIFSYDGVYHEHPQFVSYLETVFMGIIGPTIQAWRLAYAVYALISVIAFYFFTRSFSDKMTAIIASSLLAFSHYYIIFAHQTTDFSTGIVMILISLVFFLAAIKGKSASLMYFAGVFTGLCFYVHFLARGTTLLLIIFAILLIPKRYYINYLLPAFFGIITTVQFFNPEQITLTGKAISRSIFTQTSLLKILENSPFNYLKHLIYAILTNCAETIKSIFHFSGTDHFIHGSLLDLITVSGLILGLITVIFWTFKKNKIAIGIFSIFIIYFMLTAAFHGISNPAVTRIYFLIPFLIVISAIGIGVFIKGLFVSRQAKALCTILILLMVLGANTYRIYFTNRMEDYRGTKGYSAIDPTSIINASAIKVLQTFPKQQYYIIINDDKSLLTLSYWYTSNLPEHKNVKLLNIPYNKPVNLENFPVEKAIILVTRPENIKRLKNINIINNYYYRICSSTNFDNYWLDVYIPKKHYTSRQLNSLKTRGYAL